MLRAHTAIVMGVREVRSKDQEPVIDCQGFFETSRDLKGGAMSQSAPGSLGLIFTALPQPFLPRVVVSPNRRQMRDLWRCPDDLAAQTFGFGELATLVKANHLLEQIL